MKIESIAAKVNIQSNTNNTTTQSNSQFSSLLNTQISSIVVKDRLPDNAKEQIRQEWISSLTDERFDELLDILDLNHLSIEEKKLYKSIIEDRFVTDEEVKNLSYEQIGTLGKFMHHKNGENSYVEETLINMDPVAGHLLSTPIISDNENFNKAIFEMAKTMSKDERGLTFFMHEITGVHGGSLVSYPELQSRHYDSENIADELQNIISKYKNISLDSEDVGVLEYSQNMENLFIDLLNRFNELSENNVKKIEKRNEPIDFDIHQRLLEDLLSIIQTGLTVSEVEELEELIKEINKLIDDSKERNVSENEIKDMIEKLEQKINELQKRMGMDPIIKENKDTEHQDSDMQLTQAMKELKSIVRSLVDVFTKIKDESNYYPSTQDEMELRKQLKQLEK
ncbi:MAG: hypothetical protein M0P43_00050 [Arcobacteraceae bacterium]|nr:hypothetical protein [Arcobacteraceae bacterium]MDY0326700.1 hypothetical protein [Arcobacteraceae bacterium]